ncbi:hypothetical protein BC829DRAFT_424950 [Chytridium lagenaria]|nr:hypothetical protein BC829DRAFT_424950 [Chytridium lagenaria]
MENVFVGAIIHSLVRTAVDIIPLGVLGVDSEGKIAFVEKVDEKSRLEEVLENLSAQYSFQIDSVIKLSPSQFLIPGLIDTHIHAPQYVFTGTGTDLPLLEWLQKYTFPRESAFQDVQYARGAYARAVSRSARCGTTTACYYGTLHLEASKILVDVVHAIGQRAFVGKVNMDRNSPEYYTETTQSSMKDTEQFVDYVASVQSSKITPVLTPRFVPSCTPELMAYLGDLALERNLPIQSHLSENRNEIKWVSELHPDITTYTGVYKQYGLLNNRSVMAHCIHLSAEERKMMRETGAGVSHCPTSNFSLVSGVLNVRRLLDESVKVGLGTDVAGGYSPSILDTIRHAIVASKVVAARSQETADGDIFEPLSYAEAFYLATVGDRVGNFVKGKEFDALLVDLSAGLQGEIIDLSNATNGGPLDIFPHDDITTAFEKFIFLGDDRNISQVWVQGKRLSFESL